MTNRQEERGRERKLCGDSPAPQPRARLPGWSWGCSSHEEASEAPQSKLSAVTGRVCFLAPLTPCVHAHVKGERAR